MTTLHICEGFFIRKKSKILAQKKPHITVRLLKSASTYSPTIKTAVPSAQAGLTSLFEMGRGGPCCYRHPKLMLISDGRSTNGYIGRLK